MFITNNRFLRHVRDVLSLAYSIQSMQARSREMQKQIAELRLEVNRLTIKHETSKGCG